MKIRTWKAAAASAAVTLAAGLATVSGAPPAHAGSGNQFCLDPGNSRCVNAWNGGPFVKLNVPGSGGANSDFTEIGGVSGHIILRYTGNSGWAGHCIGDAYNDPGHADASLNTCDYQHGNLGWGVLFDPDTTDCSAGRIAFRNVHWGGYLGPADPNTNGSPMYLNKPGPYCYYFFSAE